MHRFHEDLQSNLPMRMALGIFWFVTEMAQLDGSEPAADGTLENAAKRIFSSVI